MDQDDILAAMPSRWWRRRLPGERPPLVGALRPPPWPCQAGGVGLLADSPGCRPIPTLFPCCCLSRPRPELATDGLRRDQGGARSTAWSEQSPEVFLSAAVAASPNRKRRAGLFRELNSRRGTGQGRPLSWSTRAGKIGASLRSSPSCGDRTEQ
jgi:hypothetical protein